MNDAEYEQQKARVLYYTRKWQNRMWLAQWTLAFTWYREGIPGSPGAGADAAGLKGLFCCHSLWEYQRAEIDVSLEGVRDADDAYLEKALIHEMAHCLLAEVRHVSDDFMLHEEHVCTAIENIVVYAVAEAADGELHVTTEEGAEDAERVEAQRAAQSGQRVDLERRPDVVGGGGEGGPETRPVPAYAGGVNGASEVAGSDRSG